MSLVEIEYDVKKVVQQGSFTDFAKRYLIDSRGSPADESRLDLLWLAIHNNRETMVYNAIEQEFGHRPDFQLHGTSALTQRETVPVNRSIAPDLQPFQDAFQVLQQYKKERRYEA